MARKPFAGVRIRAVGGHDHDRLPDDVRDRRPEQRVDAEHSRSIGRIPQHRCDCTGLRGDDVEHRGSLPEARQDAGRRRLDLIFRDGQHDESVLLEWKRTIRRLRRALHRSPVRELAVVVKTNRVERLGNAR